RGGATSLYRCSLGLSLRAVVQLSYQPAWGDRAVRLLDVTGYLAPLLRLPQVDTQPPASADVGRLEEARRITGDQRSLGAAGRSAPQAGRVIAVVMVEVDHELLLVRHEPGWLSMTETLGGSW